VRVEIMKAIVKKCASSEERMFLHQFCNRPTVRIANTRTKIERVLTFTDLVENYGSRMNDKELDIAYRRAGYKFKGQMKQIFGILKEREELRQQQTEQRQTQNERNGNNTKLGTRKRMVEEQEKEGQEKIYNSTKKINNNKPNST
jgi:hypothetical protein